MKFIVHYRGSPVRECATLVEAYMLVRDEFKKRWPRAFYGPQEAAAHGYEVVGKPELTPEEARELAAELRSGRHETSGPLDLARALRQGTT